MKAFKKNINKVIKNTRQYESRLKKVAEYKIIMKKGEDILEEYFQVNPLDEGVSIYLSWSTGAKVNPPLEDEILFQKFLGYV